MQKKNISGVVGPACETQSRWGSCETSRINSAKTWDVSKVRTRIRFTMPENLAKRTMMFTVHSEEMLRMVSNTSAIVRSVGGTCMQHGPVFLSCHVETLHIPVC